MKLKGEAFWESAIRMEVQFVTIMGTEAVWRDFGDREKDLIAGAAARSESVIGLSRARGKRLQVDLGQLTITDMGDGYTQSIRWRPSAAQPWKQPGVLISERVQLSVAGGKVMRADAAKHARTAAAKQRDVVNSSRPKVLFGTSAGDLHGKDMIGVYSLLCLLSEDVSAQPTYKASD